MSDAHAGPPGSVSWALEGGARELDEGTARRALSHALRHGGGVELVVDLVFVDRSTLSRLHSEFLGDPSETDVITFDLRGDGPSGGPAGQLGPDGEIYVSVDRARAVAEQRGVSVERELTLYVVHGALHLVGFDDHDPDDRGAMRAAEATIMGALGHAPEDAPHDS